MLERTMTDSLDSTGVAKLQAEEWRPVAGLPAYEVSDHGRVRRRTGKGRWPAGHVLQPAQAHSGHLYVILTRDAGHPKKHFVHRLIAAAFVGPAPFEGAMVLHHDDNPTHNRPSNLYWGNRTQNVRDARLNRERPGEVSQPGARRGEANSSAKLSQTDVSQIRRYLDLGLCGSCIARIYGVKKETIYSIAKGRTWAHPSEGSA
jgi:hypothetical protein